MKVIKAKAMGMCFGVRDALEIIAQLPTPEHTTIYGELVHNPKVLETLTQRGIRMISEMARTPLQTESLVITAHGVSDKERQILVKRAKTVYDTTCPLVRKVHQQAQAFAAQGYFVLVIGRSGHVEVQGIVGDLTDYAVITQPSEVTCYPAKQIGVVCQTTTPPNLAAAIRMQIQQQNPDAEVQYADTICRPTRDRQQAVTELLDQVEAVVVVGGHNSNNTRQLAELCTQQGVPCVQVEAADELPLAWLHRYQVVGVTAGTSTLETTIEQVCTVLRNLH